MSSVNAADIAFVDALDIATLDPLPIIEGEVPDIISSFQPVNGVCCWTAFEVTKNPFR